MTTGQPPHRASGGHSPCGARPGADRPRAGVCLTAPSFGRRGELSPSGAALHPRRHAVTRPHSGDQAQVSCGAGRVFAPTF